MSFIFKVSDGNPNTRENSEEAFCEGGRWEIAGGRRQTRLFAECFHRHVKVPLHGRFSVLDVGCALGDASPVWYKKYPYAKLYGCDISETAIIRCQSYYGNIANFFRASFEEIDGYWDVIYCSNVLEHFERSLDIAREFLRYCHLLYIITPYGELQDGKPLKPTPGSFHVATFFEDTFAELEISGHAMIKTHIVSCPGAWGPEGWELLKMRIKYWIVGKALPFRQIIYCIEKIKK